MIPSFPSIPTDSLPRFLAVTGWLVLVAPPIYLTNKVDTIELDTIHVRAEKRIMDIRQTALDNEISLMNIRIYGKDISTLPPLRKMELVDSLANLHKLAGISLDSARIGLAKIAQRSTEQKITEIKLNEKDEIIKQNISSVKEFLSYRHFFLIAGGLMALVGMTVWGVREGIDIILLKKSIDKS
jgi:hypothetical protein